MLEQARPAQTHSVPSVRLDLESDLALELSDCSGVRLEGPDAFWKKYTGENHFLPLPAHTHTPTYTQSLVAGHAGAAVFTPLTIHWGAIRKML